MGSVYSKTLAPLLILKILEEHSDEQHPLTREAIEYILDCEYGITMERKAFFRHLEHLRELEDIDIRRITVKPAAPDKKACAGFYIADRPFSETDLRVIIDALSGSYYLSRWETDDLVRRLSALSGPNFKKKMSAYQFIGRDRKTDNQSLLLNLEIIDEAIAEQKQIRFALLRTDNDGQKVLSDWQNETCTPIQYFVKDHLYYLIGLHSFDGDPQAVSYALSSMINVEKIDEPALDIRSLPEFKNGVDWQKFLQEHPVMHWLRGKAERCTFLCYRWMIDDLKRHFGDELRIRRLSHEENEAVADTLIGAKKEWLVEVSVITDPYAAVQFAWSHPQDLWLISPKRANQSLRHRLKMQQQRYDAIEQFYQKP